MIRKRTYLESSCKTCGCKKLIRKEKKDYVPPLTNCRSCNGRNNGAKAKRVKTGKFVKCSFCKNEFWEYKHLSNKRKFCSKQCADQSRQKYERTTNKCIQCFSEFLRHDKPFSNSTGQFCSLKCKQKHFATGIKVVFKRTKEQARAGSAIRAAIKKGELKRPSNCEQCNCEGFIEAAHYNYLDPLNVRWLCRSCHRHWDSAVPKGGSIRIILGENHVK